MWMSSPETSTTEHKLSSKAVAYEPSYIEALEPALDDIAKYEIKVAVNAGTADTKGLHETVVQLVAKKGLKLKVA